MGHQTQGRTLAKGLHTHHKPSVLWWTLGVMLWVWPLHVFADRTARFDPVCSHMVDQRTAIPIARPPGGVPYFEHPIPKRLFLVSLCAEEPSTASWREHWRLYAASFGYPAYVVTQPLGPQLKKDLPPGMLRMIRGELSRGQCELAEKLMRAGLLATIGGLAIDTRVLPPKQGGAWAALEKVMPTRGLVVLAGEKPQNTRAGVSGFTADDAFLAAAPGHPVLQTMCETLAVNLASLRLKSPAAGPPYLAGHIFLSRALSGSFTVLPRQYAEHLALVRGAK